MNNINIYPLKENEDTSVIGILPTRYAYSINYIVPLIFSDSSLKVQLINYDPINWKTWFPFYSTTNDFYEFEKQHKEGIYSELNEHLKSINSSNYYLVKAEKEFMEKFDCGNIKTTKIINELTQSEIKYSQTMNVWTIYKTDYVILTEVEDSHSLFNRSDNNIELIDIEELQEKGICEYKNIPIVKNYCNILKENNLLKIIRKHAIHIDPK